MSNERIAMNYNREKERKKKEKIYRYITIKTHPCIDTDMLRCEDQINQLRSDIKSSQKKRKEMM